jgi:hypothetical protein
MRALHLRSAAIVLVAAVGLGGCATYSPFGYGNGVSVSYGDRYHDPYYDRYSPYASRYGSRYGYGYGAGYAPYGWYDGYYYPGAGYYVYDRYRNPYYWSDGQRRYWTVRHKDPSVREVWADFARDRATQSGTTQAVRQRITTSRVEQPVRTNRVERRIESGSSVTERIRARAATRRPPVQED